MYNNIGPSIYIPTDKNLYDAFQHKKVKHSDVLKFLRNRGIIVSPKLNKNDLSKIISQLTFDYHDYCFLKNLLENPNRKEKTTLVTVKASADNQELIKVCDTVKNNDNGGDSYKVVKKDNSTILIVTYTDIDFTKTELRQRSIKKCEIILNSSDDEITMRMPATKKGKEIAQKLQTSLSEIKGKELEEEVVSLANITSPKARSFFFDELIKSISGYKLDDVSSVDIVHETDDLESISEDDMKEPSNLAGYIRKAVLAGGGVLESAEFNQLHSRGFFISKIIWTAIDTLPSGDKVELEAQFGNPESCADFKYLVRGIYKYNEKTSSYNRTKRAPSRIETDSLNTLLEKAAKTAFEKVIAEYYEDRP